MFWTSTKTENHHYLIGILKVYIVYIYFWAQQPNEGVHISICLVFLHLCLLKHQFYELKGTYQGRAVGVFSVTLIQCIHTTHLRIIIKIPRE